MNVNREDLKRLIDTITEEEAGEVYDFIGYLNLKRNKEAIDQIDFELFSEDEKLIQQIQKSRRDRATGRVYDEEQGLKYLQNKISEYESE